jgi:hypothetical protein
VEKRYSLGAEYHYPIVPIAKLGEPLLLGGCESKPPAFIDQGMEEDAILNRRLAVTYLLECVVIERGESIEYRLEIGRHYSWGSDGGAQDKTSLLLQSTPMLLGALPQLVVDLGREVEGYGGPGHQSFLVT